MQADQGSVYTGGGGWGGGADFCHLISLNTWASAEHHSGCVPRQGGRHSVCVCVRVCVCVCVQGTCSSFLFCFRITSGLTHPSQETVTD